MNHSEMDLFFCVWGELDGINLNMCVGAGQGNDKHQSETSNARIVHEYFCKPPIPNMTSLSLSLYIYIYVYVCMHTYTYTCMYVYIYIYIYTYIHTSTYYMHSPRRAHKRSHRRSARPFCHAKAVGDDKLPQWGRNNKHAIMTLIVIIITIVVMSSKHTKYNTNTNTNNIHNMISLSLYIYIYVYIIYAMYDVCIHISYMYYIVCAGSRLSASSEYAASPQTMHICIISCVMCYQYYYCSFAITITITVATITMQLLYITAVIITVTLL